MTTPTEIAWAAGIFEGEGCISVNKGGKPGGGLIVRMTDRDVLERFQAALGGVGHLHGPFKTYAPHHKPPHEWRCHIWADVVLILDQFRPYLGERRRAKMDTLYAQPITGLEGRRSQTECLRGHPLTGPDADVHHGIRRGGGPYRRCRVCDRARRQNQKENSQ